MFPETELNSRKYGAARICQAAESDGDRQITKTDHREGEPSSITHSARTTVAAVVCCSPLVPTAGGLLGYDHNPNRHAIDSRGGTARRSKPCGCRASWQRIVGFVTRRSANRTHFAHNSPKKTKRIPGERQT